MALTDEDAKQVGLEFMQAVATGMDLEEKTLALLKQIRADIAAKEASLAKLRQYEAEALEVLHGNFPWHRDPS